MTTRERRLDRAAWLIVRDMEQVGSDLRASRLGAGLSLRDVGTRVGVSASVILGTERGRPPGPRPQLLARHAAAVGMRIRLHAYPDGSVLRDASQTELARRFRSRVHREARVLPEQPVTADPLDQRAFDLLVVLPDGTRCAVELVTRIHDCQALLRRIQLKMRDGQVDRLMLIVRATHHNRRAMAEAEDLLRAAIPLRTRKVMTALANGRDPGANGLALI